MKNAHNDTYVDIFLTKANVYKIDDNALTNKINNDPPLYLYRDTFFSIVIVEIQLN